MDRQALAPCPGLADHGGLADVDHLFEDIELAQPAVPLALGRESIELGAVLPAHILHMPQPVVDQP